MVAAAAAQADAAAAMAAGAPYYAAAGLGLVPVHNSFYAAAMKAQLQPSGGGLGISPAAAQPAAAVAGGGLAPWIRQPRSSAGTPALPVSFLSRLFAPCSECSLSFTACPPLCPVRRPSARPPSALA